MKSPLMKRLERVERSLAPSKENWPVVILDWANDPEETGEDKLARWRAGEDIEGAPTDIEDRENADVILIVDLLPPSEAPPTKPGSRQYGGCR